MIKSSQVLLLCLIFVFRPLNNRFQPLTQYKFLGGPRQRDKERRKRERERQRDWKDESKTYKESVSSSSCLEDLVCSHLLCLTASGKAILHSLGTQIGILNHSDSWV